MALRIPSHRSIWTGYLMSLTVATIATSVSACEGAKANGDKHVAGKADKVQAASKSAASPKATASGSSTRVEIAALTLSTASISTTIPGEVDGSREATLASALGGPVERLLVSEGDHVKRGQLVVLVDAALYDIRKRQAQIHLDSALRDLNRSQGLGTAMAQAERDRRQSLVDAAQVELDLATLQLQRSRVVAPFAGIVAKTHTEVGEVVAPTAPLVDLVQLDPVHVVLSVPDRDVIALELGAPVTVHIAAMPNSLKGTISRISPTGDRDTRAFEAEVSVDNADLKIKPGMIATVSIDRTLASGATVIPQDWLVTRRDGVGVFVDEGGKARFVAVKPGQIVRDQVVIAEGLLPGARLVIRGHRDLTDGDPLSVAREGVCCTNGRAQFD